MRFPFRAGPRRFCPFAGLRTICAFGGIVHSVYHSNRIVETLRYNCSKISRKSQAPLLPLSHSAARTAPLAKPRRLCASWRISMVSQSLLAVAVCSPQAPLSHFRLRVECRFGRSRSL